MGLDPVIVERRLVKILEEVDFLNSIRKQELDDFLRDGKSLRSTAKAIETIVQSIIDISSHIVAQNHWGVTDTYRNTIALLAKHQIISEDLSANLQKVVAMRNILVHQYLDVDFSIVWESLEELVEDALAYIGAIKSYLQNPDE
ncbi:MAG: type VII toxin-antitoxin system HepT family RNase toxin [Candidatus Thorarchaeota archaeon]